MSKYQTRDEVVLQVLLALKEGSAFDIIRQYEKDHPGMRAEDMQRFCAGVHGSCSQLHDKGKIRRVRVINNPTTGAEVYVYAVEAIQRRPTEKLEKGYKEKAERLELELAKANACSEQLAKELLVFKNDSIRKDDLADAFFVAQESGDMNQLKKLFVRKAV